MEKIIRRIEHAKTYRKGTNCASFVAYIAGKINKEYNEQDKSDVFFPGRIHSMFEKVKGPKVNQIVEFYDVEGEYVDHLAFINKITKKEVFVLEREGIHSNVQTNTLNKLKEEYVGRKIRYYSMGLIVKN